MDRSSRAEPGQAIWRSLMAHLRTLFHNDQGLQAAGL